MQNKKVIILDYQLGNLFSVKQACAKVGIDAEISSNKNDIAKADAIILPGVGAFMEAMHNLKSLDLIQPLDDFIASSKPLFGICLGLQLLFTESEEFGTEKGLNYIKGKIRKFPIQNNLGENIKVPQIGWNRIIKNKTEWENTPLLDVKNHSYMYFVHSYYVEPENSENIITKTNYEEVEYCSGVINNSNIFATQFHPEKSGEVGLSIYSNWAKLNKLIK
jgi:glutamine amidotransferase